jgi:hypothetical protein
MRLWPQRIRNRFSLAKLRPANSEMEVIAVLAPSFTSGRVHAGVRGGLVAVGIKVVGPVGGDLERASAYPCRSLRGLGDLDRVFISNGLTKRAVCDVGGELFDRHVGKEL